MSADAYELALAQIEAADLPCPVYRTARRLLDRAAATDGFVALSDADLRGICQSEAEGTLRSHLIQMQAAGIIRYNRRGLKIRIFFESWQPSLEPRDDIKVIAQRSLVKEDDIKVIAERSNRALSDHFYVEEGEKVIAERSFRALSDQKSASTSHARSGWLVGSLSSSHKKKKPTNQPQPPNPHDPPLEPLQQLAFELLIDSEVGVLQEAARILAKKLPATEIYRVVDEWLPDRRAGKVRPGLLRWRLDQLAPSDAPTVTLSVGFRDSELFHRHRLPDEMIADSERKRYNLNDYTDSEPRKKYSR
jgi:hypothetical protein